MAGSEGGNGWDRRGRGRRERRGEWRSSAVESEESRCRSLEERIRVLTERTEGLERRTRRMEEKRRNAGLRRMERKEMGSGNGMVKVGGTR